MYDMFTALPLSSHVLTAPAEAGLNAAPAPSTRLRPESIERSPEPMSFWPFLLLQKPRVSPPPCPRQRLPKVTSFSSSAARVRETVRSEVWSQFVSTGVASVKDQSPASTVAVQVVYTTSA